MIFTANDRYWAGRPKLDRIEYVMANQDRTTAQRLDAYKRGDVDMSWLAFESWPAVEADPILSHDLVQLPRAATIHIAFNMNKAPFIDKKVRQAFSYAFDRESYCRDINYGFCTPTLSWIPPGVPGHIDADAYAFDPQKAREALAQSSYGGPARLPAIVWYYTEGDAKGQREAEWLATQYRSVLGVELTLKPVPDGAVDTMMAKPATRPQLLEQGWFEDFPDPENWLSAVWTCNSGYNHMGFCDPAFDALTTRADAELDPQKRLALYQQAEKTLIADAPTIFLFNWAEAALVKPYITGYAHTPIDSWPGWTTLLTIDVTRPA
jgi:oligopeptide transport system substrate-binding protein